MNKRIRWNSLLFKNTFNKFEVPKSSLVVSLKSVKRTLYITLALTTTTKDPLTVAGMYTFQTQKKGLKKDSSSSKHKPD